MSAALPVKIVAQRKRVAKAQNAVLSDAPAVSLLKTEVKAAASIAQAAAKVAQVSAAQPTAMLVPTKVRKLTAQDLRNSVNKNFTEISSKALGSAESRKAVDDSYVYRLLMTVAAPHNGLVPSERFPTATKSKPTAIADDQNIVNADFGDTVLGWTSADGQPSAPDNSTAVKFLFNDPVRNSVELRNWKGTVASLYDAYISDGDLTTSAPPALQNFIVSDDGSETFIPIRYLLPNAANVANINGEIMGVGSTRHEPQGSFLWFSNPGTFDDITITLNYPAVPGNGFKQPVISAPTYYTQFTVWQYNGRGVQKVDSFRSSAFTIGASNAYPIFQTLLNSGTSFLDCEAGYYAVSMRTFVLSLGTGASLSTPVPGQSFIALVKGQWGLLAFTGGDNPQWTVYAHLPLVGLYTNAKANKQFHFNGLGMMCSLKSSLLNQGGDAYTMQIPAGDQWFEVPFSEEGFFAAYPQSLHKGMAPGEGTEGGIYVPLRPANKSFWDLRKPCWSSTTALQLVEFPLESDQEFLCILVNVPPNSGTSNLAAGSGTAYWTLTAAWEYVTQDTWRQTIAPQVDPLVWDKFAPMLGKLPVMYDNPTHFLDIASQLFQGIVKYAPKAIRTVKSVGRIWGLLK